jgi:hypothetical protein
MKPKGDRATFKIMLFRLAGVGLAAALFYGVSWLPLRVIVRDGLAWVMRHAGFPTAVAVYEGSPALRIGDKQLYFTPDCTYIDLWLISIPLLWRLDWPRALNVCWILVFGIIVIIMNLIRLLICIYFYYLGHSWLVAHELPDFALYYSTLAVVVITTLRHDWTFQGEKQKSAPSFEDAPGATC